MQDIRKKKVSYDPGRNRDAGIAFDAFKPGADTLSGGMQSTAFDKIHMLHRVVEGMLYRECTKTERERFAIVLNEHNDFDARAWTVFARHVHSRVPVTTTPVRFFDLLDSVKRHMTLLAGKTNHTERYPHSMSRWFMWLRCEQAMCSNVRNLGDILAPMCSRQTAQQMDEKTVCSHVCEYCQQLRHGTCMPTRNANRCSERGYFAQAVPFTNVVFAVQADDWSHTRATTKKLDILTGFGQQACDVGVTGPNRATLRFGPKYHNFFD